jgi:hypothetical protein
MARSNFHQLWDAAYKQYDESMLTQEVKNE